MLEVSSLGSSAILFSFQGFAEANKGGIRQICTLNLANNDVDERLLRNPVPETSRGTTVVVKPAASSLGRTVSPGSSSAHIRTTDPSSHVLPSGHLAPVETRAAMSVVRKLLPSPGLPTRSVIRPSAILSCHNHETSRGSMSAKQVRTGCKPLDPVPAAQDSKASIKTFAESLGSCPLKAAFKAS